MDLNDQIRRHFGTTDLAAVVPAVLDAGIEHMLVDLGLTKEPGERFALWTLQHTLGAAPELDVVFKDAQERDAARNLMDLLER